MKTAKVLIADSETCADLYWATHFFVPDPMVFFQIKKRKTILVSDLEFARARKEAEVDEVLNSNTLAQKTGKRGDVELAALLLKERGVKVLEIPSYFPAGAALALKKKGFRLEIVKGSFFPERVFKTNFEKQAIITSLRATEAAITRGVEVLRASRVKKTKSGKWLPLQWQGKPLTSEILRGVINGHMMERGFVGKHTIVAGGRQAADPHCTGFGPLYPHQAIVLDVFPRSEKTGYHADITRTVCRGAPSETLQDMYKAVQAAQQAGMKAVRGGVDAAQVHQKVCDVLVARGFKTERIGGKLQGYIHSTGHGLGLDIHEPPRVSRLSDILKPGHVVTVEPGLYYEKIGGIRIEDVVFVTRAGNERLTRLAQHFVV